MTRGISRYIWPLELPTHTLDRARVTRACQALALDEERTTFHPRIVERAGVPPGEFDPNQERRFIKDEQLSQVWFAGVHSNVGGGYPDDTLAYIPFVWMITEAQRCGLKFKSDAPVPPRRCRRIPTRSRTRSRNATRTAASTIPARGSAAITAMGRASWFTFCNPIQEGRRRGPDRAAENPRNVFRRIDNRAHAYSPVGLPPVYDVVREDGEIVTPDSISASQTVRNRHLGQRATRRNMSGTRYGNAGSSISRPSAPRWGCWCFRCSAARSAPTNSQARSVGLRSLRFVSGFLPGFASTWIDGYARAPGSFLCWPAGLMLTDRLAIAGRISNPWVRSGRE